MFYFAARTAIDLFTMLRTMSLLVFVLLSLIPLCHSAAASYPWPDTVKQYKGYIDVCNAPECTLCILFEYVVFTRSVMCEQHTLYYYIIITICFIDVAWKSEWSASILLVLRESTRSIFRPFSGLAHWGARLLQ